MANTGSLTALQAGAMRRARCLRDQRKAAAPPAVEPAGQRTNAGNSLAADKLPADVGGQGADQDREQPASKGKRAVRDALELVAAHEAQPHKHANPQQRTQSVEQ